MQIRRPLTTALNRLEGLVYKVFSKIQAEKMGQELSETANSIFKMLSAEKERGFQRYLESLRGGDLAPFGNS